MKQMTRNLIVAGAMLAAGSAVAAAADTGFHFHRPIVGVDYLQAWMSGTGSITTYSAGGVADTISAKSAFRSSSPGVTIYVGFKFTEYFGIELGWDSSFASTKKTVASPTTSPIPGGYRYTAKVIREGIHGDLIGFLPMMDCWDLFVTFGVGMVKPKISSQSLVANTAAEQALLDAGTNLPFRNKRTSILRLGVGTSYMFTKTFGVRAKLGWEGTGDLSVKYGDYTTAKLFKDSTTVAVGLFAHF